MRTPVVRLHPLYAASFCHMGWASMMERWGWCQRVPEPVRQRTTTTPVGSVACIKYVPLLSSYPLPKTADSSSDPLPCKPSLYFGADLKSLPWTFNMDCGTGLRENSSLCALPSKATYMAWVGSSMTTFSKISIVNTTHETVKILTLAIKLKCVAATTPNAPLEE